MKEMQGATIQNSLISSTFFKKQFKRTAPTKPSPCVNGVPNKNIVLKEQQPS